MNCFKKDDLKVEYDSDNNIEHSFEHDNFQTTENCEIKTNYSQTTVAHNSSESETEEKVNFNEAVKCLFTLQKYFKKRNPEVLSKLLTVELDLYKSINDSKK
jgi:hypothetical protein